MIAGLQPRSVSDPDQARTAAFASIADADVNSGADDALLRFAAGMDDGDLAMLESAFAQDAVVDFGACGRAIGLDFEPLVGAATITGFLVGTSRRQVTSHVVSNPRVQVSGNHARLRALVDATHIVRADRARRFRMMNWYDADLVQIDGHWQIGQMAIENIWFEGDPAILMLREGLGS